MYLEWKQNEHLNFMFILAIRYFIYHFFIERNGLPSGSDGKESACNVGDLGSIPGSGRFPREGNGYPLHYACLENPMDRGAWWATVHGVAESQTRLSDATTANLNPNYPSQ